MKFKDVYVVRYSIFIFLHKFVRPNQSLSKNHHVNLKILHEPYYIGKSAKDFEFDINFRNFEYFAIQRKIYNENINECSKYINEIVASDTNDLVYWNMDKSEEIKFRNPDRPSQTHTSSDLTGTELEWVKEYVVSRFTRKPTIIILIQRNVHSLFEKLVHLYNSPLWNRRAFFQFIIETDNHNVILFVRVLVQFYHIFSFVIFTRPIDYLMESDLEIITIENELHDCGKKFTLKNEKCFSGNLKKSILNLPTDSKINNLFSSCLVRIKGAFGVIDIGPSLLKVFAQKSKFNVSVEIVAPKEFFLELEIYGFKPGKISSSFISIHGWGLATSVSMFDSMPEAYVYATTAVFAIPASKSKPPWKTAMQSFSGVFWCASLTSYVVVSLVFYVLRYGKERILLNFFDAYSINITSILIFSRISSKLRIRILVICWILYSMHFNVAFSTGYFNSLVNPSFDRQIKTLEEINDAEMPVYVETVQHPFVKEQLGTLKYAVKPLNNILDQFTPYRECVLLNDRRIANLGSKRRECFKMYIYPHGFRVRWVTFVLYFKQIFFENDLKMMVLFLHQAGFGKYFDKFRGTKPIILGEYWSDTRYCDLVSESFELELKHVVIPFVALFCSVLFGSIALQFEIWLNLR